MKCNHCGEEIANDSTFCEFCGNQVSNADDNKKGVGFWFGAIFSFLIPIVGFVLYFVKRKEQPSKAKTYLWCAIAGAVLGLIMQIVG